LLSGLVEEPQEIREIFQQQLSQETASVFLLARAIRESRWSAIQQRLRKEIARELVTIAYTGSQKEKRQATALLILLLGPQIREALLNLIQTPQSSQAQQSAAILALGQLGDPYTFEMLLTILQHREAETTHSHLIDAASARMAAIWALGQFEGPRTVEALIQIISDETETRPLQWAATWMLGN